MGKTYIIWTTEERRAVVQAAAAARLKNPKLSELQALASGMLALRPARRRKIAAVQAVPWFISELRAAEAPRTPQEARHEAPAPQPPATPAADPMALLGQLAALLEQAATIAATIVRSQAPAAPVEAEAAPCQHSVDTPAQASPEPPREARRGRKPKVAVVGAWPQQERQIAARVGEDVEVVFLGRRQLRGSLPAVDFCLQTRTTKHKTANALVSRYGKDRFAFLPTQSVEQIATKIRQVARSRA